MATGGAAGKGLYGCFVFQAQPLAYCCVGAEAVFTTVFLLDSEGNQFLLWLA